MPLEAVDAAFDWIEAGCSDGRAERLHEAEGGLSPFRRELSQRGKARPWGLLTRPDASIVDGKRRLAAPCGSLRRA